VYNNIIRKGDLSMNIKKMTIDEIKKHYGKRYSKIINALSECKKDMVFSIDLDCGRYLELMCENDSNFYFKVNHGISNTYPYNIWHKTSSFYPVEMDHFKTQDDVVVYIMRNLK
jgi:hypothetical protein